MSRNIMYKYREVDAGLDKITNVTPIKENNQTDITYLLAPFGADTVMLKLLPNKFYELTNVNPIPAFKCTRITDQEVIDALVPEGEGETGWYLYYFPIVLGVSNILKSNRASQYQVSFQRLEVDLTDDDYIGNYATASTVDATISTELDVAYPSADEGNYVNVYKTTSNLYTSWLLVSTTWVDQDELTNETLVGNTLIYNETFKATTVSNDEFNIGSATEQALVFNQIYGELEDINVVLAAIVGDVAGLMTKAEFNILGLTGIVDKAAGLENAADTSSIKIASDEMTIKADSIFAYTNHATDFSEIDILDSQIEISNFDTTNGDSEIYLVNGEIKLIAPLGVRLYDEAGTDYATIDFANGDLRVIYNGITKEYGKNLFVGIKARTIIGEGVVIQYDGAVGTSGKIWVKIADEAEINVAPYLIVGVTTTTLTANEEQDVNYYGAINEIDTTGYDGNSGTSADEGAILYFDSINGNGGMTLDKPEAPNVQIKIGIISVYHATAGQIKVRPDIGYFLGDAHDVHFNGHTFIGDEIMNYNITNDRWELKNLNDYTFSKTGWPVDVNVAITLAFENSTRTFTLSKTIEDVDYWCSNVKYTLSTDKTVVIDDTEGLWFIYLVGSTLTASQTAWDLRANDATPVSVVNWDATNNEAIAIAFEGHSYQMSGVDHYDSHFGLGTLHINGLAVSESVAGDTLDVTAGKVADEDILVSITDDDTPSAVWSQPLTPLKSYKYYRDGANGDLRRTDDSTSPFYVVGNKVQLNPYTSSWGLVDMTVNKYGAYWVIYTTDITNPVKMFLGQEEADSLNDAQENNTLSGLDLGSIPFEEIKIAYRVIVQAKVASPYYEITQIDNMLVDPVTGIPVNTPSSHGALTGLADDDHTQYHNDARGDARYDGIDTTVKKDLTTYTEDLALTGNEKVYMEDGTTAKRTTINGIATYIGGLSGTVIDTGKYYDKGLGSHDTALVKIFTMLNSTNADVYADIIDTGVITNFYTSSGVNKLIKIVIGSSLDDDTQDARLSIDNGSTYHDILVNGGTVQGSVLLGKELELKYTTDGWVVDLQSLSQLITYDSVINSTYGTVNPINGSPYINEVNGLSLNGAQSNGNFTTNLDGWSALAGSVAVFDSGSALQVTTASIGSTYQEITGVSGDVWYVKGTITKNSGSGANFYALPQGAGAGALNTFMNATAFDAMSDGEMQSFSGLITLNNDGFRIVFGRTSAQTFSLNIDDIVAVKITNTPLHSHTASQINLIVAEYFEGNKDIEDFELQSIGVNNSDLKEFTSEALEVVKIYDFIGYAGQTIYLSVDVKSDASYTLGINDFRIGGGANGETTLLGSFDGSVNASTYSRLSESLVVPSDGIVSLWNRWNVNFIPLDVDNIMISLDNTTTYTAYNSPPHFILTNKDGSVLPLRSVGQDVRDKAYELNGVWWKAPYVGYDYNDVVQSATSWSILWALTNTQVFTKDLTSELGYKLPSGDTITPNVTIQIGDIIFKVVSVNDIYNDDIENQIAIDDANDIMIRVNKTTYATSGDFETYLQANDVTFTYELDTITPIEIEKNGSTIQESNTTLIQLNNFATEYDVTFALDNVEQLSTLVKRSIYHGEEIDKNEIDIKAAQDDIVAIELKTDFISVTQAVDLDTMESQVGTNKTNADASKVITDFITVTQAVNLDNIESDVSSAKTKTDFITVTQNVDLDLMETYANLGRSVLVYTASGDGLLPESTTGTARTMSNIGSATYVEITYGKKTSGTLYQTETVKVHVDGSHYALFTADILDGTYDLIQWGAWFTMPSTTTFKWYRGVKFLDGVRSEDLTSFRLIKIVAYYDN